VKENSENIIDNLEDAAHESLQELIPPELTPATENIESVKQEAAEWKDRYLRQAAEVENYKKRSEREKLDFLKRAGEQIVKDLLPVLDNLERALENPGEVSRDTPFYQGIVMIRDSIDKVLSDHGLAEVEAIGAPFDPNQAEAIMQVVDNEAAENTVLGQMQRGYTFQGRLLRPALVTVSKRG
jgi:molecular chaperone GrpE